MARIRKTSKKSIKRSPKRSIKRSPKKSIKRSPKKSGKRSPKRRVSPAFVKATKKYTKHLKKVYRNMKKDNSH